MSRPAYETSEDLGNEEAVGRAIEAAWDCTAVKLSKFHGCDYILVRGNKGVAWAEVRCRSNSVHKYPTLQISVSKIAKLASLGRATARPVFLVIRWQEGIYYHKLAPPYGEMTFMRRSKGGAKYRGDDQDDEPVVSIPINQFERLKERKT